MSSLENVVPRRAAGHLRSGGEGALSGYLTRVLVLSLLPVTAVCLGVVFYGRELLGLLFGPGFAGFAQGMENVGTVAQAQAFLGANAATTSGRTRTRLRCSPRSVRRS